MNEQDTIQQLRKLLKDHGVFDDVRKLAQEKGLIPKPELDKSRGSTVSVDACFERTAQTAKEQDDDNEPLIFQLVGVNQNGQAKRYAHIEGNKPHTLAMLSSVLIDSLSKEELMMFIAGLMHFANQD